MFHLTSLEIPSTANLVGGWRAAARSFFSSICAHMYAYACLCTTHVGPPQVRKEATQPPMKMLSFAEHLLLQNISETLHSLQANMPCLDLEPNRKHFALFYRILFHQDQRAIMIRNNVVASQKS